MKINALCLLTTFLCHINDASPSMNSVLQHLGTKSPYRFRANKNDSRINFHGCKEKKIWMIIRHGTRLPSSKDILGMNSTLKDMKLNILLHHKLGKGELKANQIENLAAWSSDIHIENEKFLTLEGQEEMVLLAERMQKRFPSVIRNKYDNDTFLFRYTATERAQQSARYFANGLFDIKDAQEVVFAPATKVDLVLRFYKHCDKWQKQVKKNPDTYKEQILFGDSPEMKRTLQNVSKVLGYNVSLSLDKVALMFKTCGFETSWSKHYPSPWCAAFDKESAEVLEYYYDLKHYWADGYGHELTYRQACLAIKNMFDNFGQRSPNATFFFTHSGTILKLISHLGLYKPESHLRADSFDAHRSRTWKTTDIDCFASNLAFVLFECTDGDHVLTLHQERPVIMPMCESELCPLQVLIDHFYESIHNCDYKNMCSLDKSEL